MGDEVVSTTMTTPEVLSASMTTPPAHAGTPPHARRGKNVRVFSPPFLRRGGGRRPPGWSCSLTILPGWSSLSALLRLPWHYFVSHIRLTLDGPTATFGPLSAGVRRRSCQKKSPIQ